MRTVMALLALSLSIGAGCKKKEAEPVAAGSGSAPVAAEGSGSAAAGPGSAAAGSGSDAGSAAPAATDEQMSRRGGNCPSTVFGSTTKAELKDGKILVSITSEDKDAVTAIQKRSESLVKEKTDGGAPGTAHDQKGTHGGGIGLCPVHVVDGASAAVKNEANGVTVTITPKDKAEILKGEIDARIVKAADWVKANVKEGDKGTQGGVGGGAGDHGMNHSGDGDGQGKQAGSAHKGGDGKGGGKGTGGGGGAGTGGGDGKGSATK